MGFAHNVATDVPTRSFVSVTNQITLSRSERSKGVAISVDANCRVRVKPLNEESGPPGRSALVAFRGCESVNSTWDTVNLEYHTKFTSWLEFDYDGISVTAVRRNSAGTWARVGSPWYTATTPWMSWNDLYVPDWEVYAYWHTSFSDMFGWMDDRTNEQHGYYNGNCATWFTFRGTTYHGTEVRQWVRWY